MEQRITGNKLVRVYDSLAEFADAAEATNLSHIPRVKDDSDDRVNFCGATFGDAITMARKGWSEDLETTLQIAESAITMADQEHMTDSFNQPVWDVTGAMVDVGAYLAGTPECMIDYPLTETSKVGRVITLVASRAVSAVISTETVVRRGRVVVALAMALTRLGHAVEIWVDHHGSAAKLAPAEEAVRVKSVNDEIDPAVIMFALAHPAMQRRLMFANMYAAPGKWGGSKRSDVEPRPPDPSLYPEGAIILPEIHSDHDVPNADEFLRKYLGELGLLAE